MNVETEGRMSTNIYRARVFGTDAGRVIAFICECEDPDCRRTIMLTLEEYNGVRPALLLHEDHLLDQAG